jgi:hypothetical protein
MDIFRKLITTFMLKKIELLNEKSPGLGDKYCSKEVIWDIGEYWTEEKCGSIYFSLKEAILYLNVSDLDDRICPPCIGIAFCNNCIYNKVMGGCGDYSAYKEVVEKMEINRIFISNQEYQHIINEIERETGFKKIFK